MSRPYVALAVGRLAAVALLAVLTLGGCTRSATEAERVVTMYVAPHDVDCMGMIPQKCLLVRESRDAAWTYLYEGIDGFEWEAGFHYQLLVGRKTLRNPPADGSSIRYRLIRIVDRTPA